MKLFTLENWKVEIAPEALNILDFKDLVKRDKSRTKENAKNELTFIFFFCDSRSDYLYIDDPNERMEAIMRKLTAMALSMMFILGSVIPVGAEETQIRQTKISVSIDPVYTVTIPANTTIERGEQSVKLGSVSLDNARLEPDKTVNVSVSASGKLKNSKNESKTIAYKIMDGNKEFSIATYAESGNSTNLTLSIDKSEWDKAYAGSYSDTLVFTISYR